MQITKEQFRRAIPVSALLALISIAVLLNSYLATGSLLDLDIDLKGGMQITVNYEQPIDASALEAKLKSELATGDLRVRTISNPTTGKQTGIVVESGITDEKKLETALSGALGITLSDKNRSITNFGSALAATFWRQAKKAVALACLLMAVIVVFTFKEPLLSGTIFANVVLDITTTVAVMSLLHIKLSLAAIAALLMLLDYGVDSTILLYTRSLKERAGTTIERINAAFQTAFTMTAATVAALVAMLFFAHAPELRMIAGVLLIGMIADMIYTWTLNVNMVLRVSRE